MFKFRIDETGLRVQRFGVSEGFRNEGVKVYLWFGVSPAKNWVLGIWEVAVVVP